MNENLREIILALTSIIIIMALVFWAARSRSKDTQTGGKIFGYPRFITKFLWGIFIIFVVIIGYAVFYEFTKFGNYPSSTPFIILAIILLAVILLSRAMRGECLEISADGNILTKGAVFSGKITFGWNDVVEIKESKDSYGVPILVLNNGKKVKFQPMWSGRAEFFQLLSQKRPDLIANLKS